MSLNDCAVEILALIVAHADIKSLRILRAVNTVLHDLATPGAFTLMQFTNNIVSCCTLRSFVKLYTHLATYITTLAFRWTSPAAISTSGLIDRYTRRSNVTGVAIWAALDEFPALVDLDVSFSSDTHKLSTPCSLPDTEVEAGYSATEAQLCMLSALTGENAWIPQLKSLKLANLIPMDGLYSGKDRWAEILETLEKLDISVHGIGAFLQEHSELFWNRMWQSSIPNRFLRPLQRQLASLTLTSDQPVRHLDLRHLHFPMLRHLELGGIVFDNELNCPVQSFILRHGGCLSSLVLDSCPMFMPTPDAEMACSWGTVCEAFIQALVILTDLEVHLRTGWGLNDLTRSGENRLTYETLVPSYGYVRGDNLRHREDADRPALTRLFAVVTARHSRTRKS
ncbi:hypothetical protein C8Q79DRAFT_173105 [Trametes meyenii]|nr:hypothetical protein C8Q79DRAFT_173105 [Trametes meyenii]